MKTEGEPWRISMKMDSVFYLNYMQLLSFIKLKSSFEILFKYGIRAKEYYEKIILKFDIISDERSQLVRTLRNGVKKFKDDQMIDFCKQYRELFNDNEFNLYEYFLFKRGGLTIAGSEGTEESGSEGKLEEMKTEEKDANETEDNVNVNNNEMKNDSVQEKQDAKKEKAETEKEKQDKADKVDNVQEKQGDAKDEIGEDEFWNTQFTDSQCEELENQANKEIKKKKTTKRKSVIEMTPPSFSLDLSPDTNKVEERAAKRAKKPSRFIVSPYINKKTATNGKGVQDEMMICNYLFSIEGSELDEQQRKENKAFFPHRDDLIIDNSKTPMSYEAKYKKVCDVLKNMFSMHLKEVQHPRAKEVLNKKPTILRPKWGTEENNTDCGVFLMMHMENYNGENARNWNLEFPTEEEGNRYDIIKMRMRFAAKMLTHEIKIHREETSKQALEFADRNKEKKAREELIREAIRVKKQKQDSERDDRVRKRLSFSEVAVRYAVEPRPLPSAKPQTIPSAQTKPMSSS
ncbi:ulp1 protease family, C-terminal catalytic domain-containing protein [Tanacetum coccineum]